MKRLNTTLCQIFMILLFTPILANAQKIRTIHEKTFSVREGETLKLNTSTGDVYVSTWDKSEVFVKISGNKKAREKTKFRFDQTGDGVEIKAKSSSMFGFFFWNNGYLKYEIKLPRKYSTDINTSGGNIKLYDLKGNISLETSGGNLSIFNTAGNTYLNTSGGSIELENTKGTFDVSTSGGSITAKNFYGDFSASTSGGDIHIDGQDSKIKASTSGGSISLNYRGVNKGIELETSGGDIDVNVPQNIAANIDLSTSGGDIECNLPTSSTKKVSSSEYHAETNGGGKILYCNTSGGSIRVSQ